MKKFWQKREYWAMAAIVAVFVLGSIFSLISLWFLRETTRVVNFAGIVRSTSQTLVTEEFMGVSNDRSIAYIEEIINELITGKGSNGLILLRDSQFLGSMRNVQTHWERMKVHINGVRDERLRSPAEPLPYSQPSQILFQSSQIFYDLVNSAVSSAEAYSDRLISIGRVIIIAASMISLVIIILVLLFLQQLRKIAETATEEIAIMKDNLNIGIFLMDREFRIQPYYSQALDHILEEEELEGKKLTDILSSSLSAKELESLDDYFKMVINHDFDVKMLEEINPIDEMRYVHRETGKEKMLRYTFGMVDQGQGSSLILGTVEDVTAETTLQKQLSEEEDKREEEMRAVFEVIQVEPRVFLDFLEDTEYEFDRINTLLKNKDLTSRFAMVDIYQSVHAIKSNAIILGLENFSGKMQALESEIKKIQEREAIDFEDTLHITVEIEKVMREKDKFREIVSRIQSFRVGDIQRQDEYVLVQSLIRACDKAARDLGKKVELVTDFIDPQAMASDSRRLIKEVLTQLVRNAVFHGIETPAERLAQGKNETGVIRLGINIETGKIHIKLADDGHGLDFNHIREKAREMNFLTEISELEDNRHLVQFIFSPGFSTAEDAGLHAGRGIGLSLVRDRLHAINGSIRLHTEPGKGTAFHIFIPLEQGKSKVS
jgi:two-component system chemotaxis sensor kinase CheA